LIVDESESGLTSDIGRPYRIPWLRVILSSLIGAVGIYLVARNLDLSDLQSAFAQANLGYVFLAVVTIFLTILAKTWRWRFIFHPPESRPLFEPLFWALSIGQFLNVLLPMRLGEVGRAFSLERQSQVPIPKSIGTIVVEKTLDALTLGVMVFFLLPALLLPGYVSEQGYPLALLALVALAMLLLLAYRSQYVLRLFQSSIRLLPDRWNSRLARWFAEGLHGLAALRDPRLVLTLGFASAMIAGLSILTPWILFKAFDIPLAIEGAISLNLVVSIGSVPPSTPGKILIFETLVVVTLTRLGLTDSATMLSFAIVYHLVVALPQIALGALALLRGGLRFSVGSAVRPR
jgi:uncharacterized protein (TIRG00374 family)